MDHNTSLGKYAAKQWVPVGKYTGVHKVIVLIRLAAIGQVTCARHAKRPDIQVTSENMGESLLPDVIMPAKESTHW